MSRVRSILVPVDLSDASRRALDYAIFVAERLGAKIDVLYVWKAPELSERDFEGLRNADGRLLREACRRRAKAEIDRFVRDIPKSACARIKRCVAHGEVASVILEAVRKRGYDLIVIGKQGRNGRARAFAGKVAQNAIRYAPCPVLTVH
jgi:nucleotide-binding universal stress UspA family protein